MTAEKDLFEVESDSTHATFASSVYVKQGSSWKLAVHQQTPIPRDD